ncbi:MAG: hypothetical protein JSS49_26850 [Planctomycetes bacterium]|nr:hypothetical protein [Planctomycetota bacterium]
MIRFIRDNAIQLRMAFLGAALALSSGITAAQVPPSPDPVPPTPGYTESPVPGISPAEVAPRNRTAELWQDKPLGQLKASIATNLPDAERLLESESARLNQAAGVLSQHGSFVSAMGDSRPWILSYYEWEAPATRHLPLLFEEPNLERLGYSPPGCCYAANPHVSQCLQPIVSGAHFFGRVPLIPYLIGVDEPCEPIYTLGVDRPGSPVCYRHHWIPLSLKGAIYQAGATVGMLYIFP